MEPSPFDVGTPLTVSSNTRQHLTTGQAVMNQLQTSMESYHSSMIVERRNVFHFLESITANVQPGHVGQLGHVGQCMHSEDWVQVACISFQETKHDGDLSLKAKIAIIDLFNTDLVLARAYALI